MKIVFKILFTTLGVMVAAALVPGISIASFWTALLVAVVLGILNVTIGFILKIVTFPITVITFGLFSLVINALMFWAASFVKGFQISGFWAALLGSLVVTIISMLGKLVMKEDQRSY